MLTDPKIIGIANIPKTLRSFDVFSTNAALLLPDLEKDQALEIEYCDTEELRMGRKQILMASTRVYGPSKIKTGSNDTHLYVWMKEPGNELYKQLRNNFKTYGHLVFNG